jgi:crotonobetainyl-CoA:carnitine CoA-transferase CaiB-like acyl-CoA transferase
MNPASAGERRHANEATAAAAPLAGLRVVDLTRLLPGPALTMHLADFGAEVIKVEDTAEGDYLRAFPPRVEGGAGTANPSFIALNRGKRSIRLDLKQAAARAALLRIVDRSDALIESFRPGVLERLGLGWPLLHARQPRLVLCSISGYGQRGPLAHKAGHDLNYLASAGVLDQIRAGGRPAIPNLQLGDVLGGTLSALATLLVALLAAQRSGRGAWVDVAMTDGLLAHHFFPHAELDAGGSPQAESTLLTGGAACYGVYRTADGGHLALGALELKFWQNFCDGAGLPELKSNHWAHGELPGSEAARATIARVAARLNERPRAEWEQVFAPLDCCVTPVLTPAEALAQPQVAARGLVHRDGGATWIGPLAAIGDHRPAPAPCAAAGAHTREVLREAGLAADEVEALLRTGAAAEAG